MTRRFESFEDGATKFWEVTVSGSELAVRYGKIGTDGQTKTKDLGSPAAAEKERDKLVREKTGKGYAEVAAISAPAAAVPKEVRVASAPKDARAALRESGAPILDAFGELHVLDEGDEPEILLGFRSGPDGDTWASVFEAVDWIAEEADGGAIGRWRSASTEAVFYLDNEGPFRVTGRSITDHFGWLDHAHTRIAKLRDFCEAHGYPPPITDEERETLARTIETPAQRFEALKKKARAKPKATRAELAPKGPRPLATHLATCTLSDGRVLVIANEHENDGSITRGATFAFDPGASTFTEHAPLEAGSIMELLVASTGSRALLLDESLEATWENGQWRSAPATVPITFGTVALRLGDGTAIVLGGERRRGVFRVAGGEITRISDLPEARAYDAAARLPDGRVWLGAGQAKGEQYFTETRRTVLLDPSGWTFSAGPDLPAHPDRGALWALPGDRVCLRDSSGAFHVWRDGAWSAPTPMPALAGAVVTLQCADGSLLVQRWKDGTLLRVDPMSLEIETIGVLRCAQGNAKPIELADGRVLFVGGTLFHNVSAEPEIVDLRARSVTCIPGYEKDVARQEKTLAKHREKERAKGR